MQAAVLDACVLYSAPVRDLFMYLAELFQPKWSSQIHDEWMRNLLANRPDLTAAKVARTCDLMNRYGGDCLVTHYRQYIDQVILPDPDDRHVVAVALASKTPIIVTFNLTDFPTKTLAPLGIDVVHPDDFAVRLCEASPDAFCALVVRQRALLRNPPKTVPEYLTTLQECGLPKITALLQSRATEL
jgi:hypothetical protein